MSFVLPTPFTKKIKRTKISPACKAAAKRKFKVYPSAYANAYASKICAGKIKDPSGVKRKDFKGPKPAGKAMGGRILQEIGQKRKKLIEKSKPGREKIGVTKPGSQPRSQRSKMMGGGLMAATERLKRQGKMGGGMAMPRAMYGKGGGVCKRGMNRQAIGKNS